MKLAIGISFALGLADVSTTLVSAQSMPMAKADKTKITKADKGHSMPEKDAIVAKAEKVVVDAKAEKGAKSGKATKAPKMMKDGMAKAGEAEDVEEEAGNSEEVAEEGGEESGEGEGSDEVTEESGDYEEGEDAPEDGGDDVREDVDGNTSGETFFRYSPQINLDSNPCVDSAVSPIEYFFGEGADPYATVPCNATGEQSGTDISVGYQGTFETGREPYLDQFVKVGMCATNAHFHLGAEHRSEGEFEKASEWADASGPSPLCSEEPDNKLCFPDDVTRCSLYDETDSRFTTPYDFQHCNGVVVGETYEIHWPSSQFGDCGTVWQFQNPFWDGLACNFPQGDALAAAFYPEWPPKFLDTDEFAPLQTLMGVQGQVFTIINDEAYYYPDLIRGMIVDQTLGFGTEVTKYTGSRTGTSFDNVDTCDPLHGVTWQVDRQCHLISASSFDKLCADMASKAGMWRCGESACSKIPEEMWDENGCCVPSIHPSGSREVVPDDEAADNHVWDRHYRNLRFAY